MGNDTGKHQTKNIIFFTSLKVYKFFYDNLEPAGWTNKIFYFIKQYSNTKFLIRNKSFRIMYA